jgi:hypothetical protein
MQIRRTIWFGLASAAVATWLTAASAPDVRPAAAPPATQPPPQLEQSAAMMQAEVARLHARIGPTAVPDGRRDLFRFSTRSARPTPVTRRAAADHDADAQATAPPAASEAPALSLIGIAEDESSDGPVRTAIVSGLGDVFLVKAGDRIGDRFRVEEVRAGSVELFDTSTDARTTLALR